MCPRLFFDTHSTCVFSYCHMCQCFKKMANTSKILALVGLNVATSMIYCFIVLNNIQTIQDGENIKSPDNSDIKDKSFRSDLKPWHKMIPPIIHQTWRNRNIPKVAQEWVASWMSTNPGFEYWFWTDSEIKEFFAMYVNMYYTLYMWYPWSIQKADVMRYFILWMYGGTYVDLDMESLRPLGDLLLSHSCIIAQEPEELSFIHHGRNTTIVSNALMACRPRHPFMKFIINNLYSRIEMDGLLETTGPFMLTEMLIKYKTNIGPHPEWEDDVYLAPSHYFMPYYNNDMLRGMKVKCKHLIYNRNIRKHTENEYNTSETHVKQRSICFRLLSKGINDADTNGSPFTNHHWLHTYISSPPDNETVNIKQVVSTSRSISSLFLDIPPYVRKTE